MNKPCAVVARGEHPCERGLALAMTSEQHPRDVLLQAASAAAGVAVFVTLVGGGVTAARLHALGLPIDSTLAVLPQQQILVSGVRVLSGGVASSLVVLAALWLLNPTEHPETEAVSDARLLLLVPALAVVPSLAYTLAQPLAWSTRVVVVVAAAIAAFVLVLVMRRPSGFGPLRLGLFAVVSVFGAMLAFARAYTPPVKLDFADVQLKDGGRTNGYLLGQSGDIVVLAPDVLDKTIGRTVAIQRDQVIDLRISRVSRPVRPIGPQPVSGFTVAVADPHEHDLEQALLRIRLSAQWKYPPVIYRASVRAWQRRYAEFSDGGNGLRPMAPPNTPRSPTSTNRRCSSRASSSLRAPTCWRRRRGGREVRRRSCLGSARTSATSGHVTSGLGTRLRCVVGSQ